jgi:type IV pilus biogenesis protein PilP
MQRNELQRLTACCLVLACASALAAPDHGTPDLTVLGEDIAVLRARVKQLELQVMLASYESQLRKLKAPVEVPTSYALRAVEGVGRNVVATLEASDGATFEVKSGEQLPGGWTVGEIGAGSVVIKNRKGSAMLRTGRLSQPPSAAGAATHAAMPGIPPLPALPAVPVRQADVHKHK